MSNIKALELDLIRGGTLQIRAGLAWKERMKHIIPLRGFQSPKSSPYLLPVCLEEAAKTDTTLRRTLLSLGVLVCPWHI